MTIYVPLRRFAVENSDWLCYNEPKDFHEEAFYAAGSVSCANEAATGR